MGTMLRPNIRLRCVGASNGWFEISLDDGNRFIVRLGEDTFMSPKAMKTQTRYLSDPQDENYV